MVVQEARLTARPIGNPSRRIIVRLHAELPIPSAYDRRIASRIANS